jgi:hypothetical protein
MPKPKKLTKYPQQLIEFIAGLDESITTTLPFKNAKQAEAFRFDLYGLRSAITREGAEATFATFMRAKICISPLGDLEIKPPEVLPATLASVLSRATTQAQFSQAIPQKSTRPSAPPPPPSGPAQSLLAIDFSSEQAALDNFGSVLDSYYGKD